MCGNNHITFRVYHITFWFISHLHSLNPVWFWPTSVRFSSRAEYLVIYLTLSQSRGSEVMATVGFIGYAHYSWCEMG